MKKYQVADRKYWVTKIMPALNKEMVKKGENTDLIKNDEYCRQPGLSCVGLQVPEGVVGWLVVAGVTLG